MVRTNSKKHSSSVSDIKAARIEKNLARLNELVNETPETKARFEGYIMAKTNKQLQAEYRARAKQNKKQISYFISELAYQSLTDKAAEAGKTKLEILESLLLSNGNDKSNPATNNQDDSLKHFALLENCYQCRNFNYDDDRCGVNLVLTGLICSGFQSSREFLAETLKICEEQKQTISELNKSNQDLIKQNKELIKTRGTLVTFG